VGWLLLLLLLASGGSPSGYACTDAYPVWNGSFFLCVCVCVCVYSFQELWFFFFFFSWHIRGLTLHELGQQLIDQVGLVQAINLDGGSSSVLVEHRDDGRRSSSSTMRIVNHPTCLDYVSLKCERPVATVFCLGQYIENDDDGHKAMRGSSSSSPDFVVYVVP